MHARDAAGRRVSLLNDEPPVRVAYSSRPSLVTYNTSYTSFYSNSSAAWSDDARTRRSTSVTSSSSNPSTPDMACADVYEPRIAEPLSPNTPVSEYDGAAYPADSYEPSSDKLAMYHEYAEDAHRKSQKKRSADAVSSADSKSSTGKRYPCRFKASHGCDKTFTTSGHASRHSKIHTAEKAVNCSFPGCQKKFTRADNMKQHLETHYKERSRASNKSSSAAKSAIGHGVKKPSSSSAAAAAASLARHPRYESMDMGDFRHALLSHPVAARSDSSGLDALAQLASACQAQC